MFDPRDDKNLGTMVCFHRSYKLGDKHDLAPESFNGWDALEEHLEIEEGAEIILPLYLYDHGVLRMKVGSFDGHLPEGHARFDSGQVGFIYTTRKRILDEYEANYLQEARGRTRRITEAIKSRAEAILREEVKAYDRFLIGEMDEDGL